MKRSLDERKAIRKETNKRTMRRFMERHTFARTALTPAQECRLQKECTRTGETRSEVLRRLIDGLPA